MKIIAILLIAAFVVGCDNVKPSVVKVEVTPVAKPVEQPKEPPIEKWFDAINRSYSLIEQVCFDYKAQITLALFRSRANTSRDPDEDNSWEGGWRILSNIHTRELENGSVLLINPNSVDFSGVVEPNVKGLQCRTINETKLGDAK